MPATAKDFKELGQYHPLVPRDTLFVYSPEDFVQVEFKDFDGTVRISSLFTISRGKGLASQTMQEILDYADKTGTTLTLGAKAFGDPPGMTTEQLQAWYRRLGFVPKHGEGLNQNWSTEMIREPQSPVIRLRGFKESTEFYDNPDLEGQPVALRYGMAGGGARMQAFFDETDGMERADFYGEDGSVAYGLEQLKQLADTFEYDTPEQAIDRELELATMRSEIAKRWGDDIVGLSPRESVDRFMLLLEDQTVEEMFGDGWHGVDLDGTLAKELEEFDPYKIGEPIEDMVDRVKVWHENGERVKIMTARVAEGNPEVEDAIRSWCQDHLGFELEITNQKDPAMIDLWDDRAVQVEPDTGKVMGKVKE